MWDGIRLEIVCTVFTLHTHTHSRTCDNVFEKTSIVNNLKSARAELFQTWSFSFLKAGDFLGQVRCPDSILFQISCVSENQHKRKKPKRRVEWDVYATTVIMDHDGSITLLTPQSAITKENELITERHKMSWLSLCYSDFNYDRC